MSTEFPNQPDEPVNPPPAQAFPPPLPRQAEAVDWAPPPWANLPAAEPPSDPGSIAGWAPPPWTAGPDAPAGWPLYAADTRPFWRRIPAGVLIAGALVLVGVVAGWYFNASRSATGESDLSGHAYQLRVDLRVGDCFDLKEPYGDQIEDVKVPCTTEHEFEVFYVGSMGEGGYPTGEAFDTYVTQNCHPAFGAYVGKAYDDSELLIDWLVPTNDAWRSGDRTVQCAAFYPRNDRLTRSLRGTQQ
jgi:hypothetical protein